MFVQVIPEKKTGRRLIVFVEGYREGGKVRQRTVRKIGYVDEFEHLYADPISHFKAEAKRESLEMKQKAKPIMIELSADGLLPFNKDTGSYSIISSIGYAAISKILYELGIPRFIDSHRKNLNISYNLTAVTKLLVYERILHPDSKRAAWFNKGRYFEKMDFDLNAVYRSLSILNKYRDDLLVHLHLVMVDRFQRKATLLFYDTTNYYFEIEDEDKLRMKGVSKEHRPFPSFRWASSWTATGSPSPTTCSRGTPMTARPSPP